MLKTNTTIDRFVDELRFTLEVNKASAWQQESNEEGWHLSDEVVVDSPKVLSTIYRMLMKSAKFHWSIGQYNEASTYYKYAVRNADQCYSDVSTCGEIANIRIKWLKRMRASRFCYMQVIRKVTVDNSPTDVEQIWS